MEERHVEMLVVVQRVTLSCTTKGVGVFVDWVLRNVVC